MGNLEKISYDHSLLIASLEKNIHEKTKLIAELKKPASIFEDAVVRKYIETKSTKQVAEYLKALEIKRSPTANYTPCDISSIVQDRCKNIQDPVSALAMSIFSKNFKNVTFQYG